MVESDREFEKRESIEALREEITELRAEVKQLRESLPVSQCDCFSMGVHNCPEHGGKR
jgi:hypothetical protein